MIVTAAPTTEEPGSLLVLAIAVLTVLAVAPIVISRRKVAVTPPRGGEPVSSWTWVWPRQWTPGAFLVLQVLWLAAGLGVAAVTSTVPQEFALRGSAEWPNVMSPWAALGGLIGGVTISVVGISRHAHDWNPSRYAYWHLARPLLGLLTGSVAVLILLFVLKGVGGDGVKLFDPNRRFDGAAHGFMFVVAFVVGYREESFRELVKRVGDLLFVKKDDEDEASLTFLPGSLTLETTVGSTVTGHVLVANLSVTDLPGEPTFTVVPTDGPLSVTPSTATTVAARSVVALQVTFAPVVTGTTTAVLVATAQGRQWSCGLTGEATAGPTDGADAGPAADRPSVGQGVVVGTGGDSGKDNAQHGRHEDRDAGQGEVGSEQLESDREEDDVPDEGRSPRPAGPPQPAAGEDGQSHRPHEDEDALGDDPDGLAALPADETDDVVHREGEERQ